mmetsp:Transcript_17467/g.48525  ORF Transcript_17467/g.48525 Transcript_17467/m.48525 type:complete len:221 (-) Transcript_17467:635-1297(-)
MWTPMLHVHALTQPTPPTQQAPRYAGATHTKLWAPMLRHHTQARPIPPTQQVPQPHTRTTAQPLPHRPHCPALLRTQPHTRTTQPHCSIVLLTQGRLRTQALPHTLPAPAPATSQTVLVPCSQAQQQQQQEALHAPTCPMPGFCSPAQPYPRAPPSRLTSAPHCQAQQQSCHCSLPPQPYRHMTHTHQQRTYHKPQRCPALLLLLLSQLHHAKQTRHCSR